MSRTTPHELRAFLSLLRKLLDDPSFLELDSFSATNGLTPGPSVRFGVGLKSSLLPESPFDPPSKIWTNDEIKLLWKHMTE